MMGQQEIEKDAFQEPEEGQEPGPSEDSDRLWSVFSDLDTPETMMESEPAAEPVPEPVVSAPVAEPAPEPVTPAPVTEPAPTPVDAAPVAEPTPELVTPAPVAEPTPELVAAAPAVEPASPPVAADPAAELPKLGSPSFRERLQDLFNRPEGAEPASQPEPVVGTMSMMGTSEMLSLRKPTFSQRLRSGLDFMKEGNWIYGLIALLLIIALILPPVSLPQRLGMTGYTRLSADSPSASHPDGITVTADFESQSSASGALAGTNEGRGGALRVKLDAVPQLEFLEGSAGANLRAAAEAIPQPALFEVKSPYYQIDTSSNTDGPAIIEVAIPNDAEPWETLDLYTWTGEVWEWVGGTLDREREVLSAQVDHLPASVVVMQTFPVVPTIGTIASTVTDPQAAQVLNEVLLPGLYLAADGTFMGMIPSPAGGNLNSVLLIRNWQEGVAANPLLLESVLNDASIQQAHIEAIVASAAGFSGVALDYQGVSAEQKRAFTSFVSALAEALHEQNLRLEIVLPPPVLELTTWETGGYDWARLGAAADAALISFPNVPTAYGTGGDIESFLGWAVGQISRYKLRALVSSFSADASPGVVQFVGLEAALAPFGQVHTDAQTPLEPGTEVNFTMAGQVTSITRNDAAGTYTINYQAEDQTTHAIWLGTASFLARKLDWALHYNLSGATIADLTAQGNMPGVLTAVDGYRTAAGYAQPTELQVTWIVQGPTASLSEETVALSQPDFHWTAPGEIGAYTVSAAIAGTSRGSVQLSVESATPTPEPTETPVAAGDVADAGCLEATFVSDVTVPDGTRFENGESFVKTWQIKNSGSCDWPENTVLVFATGSQMGGPGSVDVGQVASGATVDISVELVAPEEPNNYRGGWIVKAADTTVTGSDVWVLIQAGDVAATANIPTAPVASGSFELGGHIANLSFPFADLMHYAGMNWAKVQVRYRGDPTGDIAAAHARGFKIQVSALGGPGDVTRPGFEEDIAGWVASMAAAGADAIEIWNEPNIDREWQIGYIDPGAYTRLLCACYQAIKAANPSTLVISAAPAPTGYFGGCSPNGCDDQPWLEGMWNAGAANCMDFIGAHHNSGATPPSARSGHPADPGGAHHSWYFLPQTELYFNIFRGTRKLFYTEMGYASQEGVSPFPGNFAWGAGTDNSEQAAWLAEAVQLGINTGMVRNIIIWNVDFLAPVPNDPQDGYAIIRPGGSCPACESLHALLGTR